MNEYSYKLSIVYITCNRVDELMTSIISVTKNTSVLFEIVLVDNGSTDLTENTFISYCEENRIPFKYHKLDQNTGVSYARNIGYKLAEGEILFFIDDDAKITKDNHSLDDIVSKFNQDKSLFAATGISIDQRFGGVFPFKLSNNQNKPYKKIQNYVGFNHFVRNKFNKKDYLYPDNLFYGSEELYVSFTILKLNGYIGYFENHEVTHYPSMNTRISRKDAKMNGHINTFVIKSYFIHWSFRLISYILFLLRILRFSKFNIFKTFKMLKIKRTRYNKKFINRLSFKQTLHAIKEYGVLNVL
ncbi:glycosyltransferase family 2 protein [Acholeplasma equirhinis]|uniref:glycosyltransferase family 2 protein n=1 Tax=Acholeplasma equirhinis TaxID=555393 RepID=UPI00197AD97F|nr:glycosyltransferase family 2 protein [Acholeplasma equirhinis]MBN3489973.1 glycosyltransferase family 2 protein [Acholeplasma equirhinis]